MHRVNTLFVAVFTLGSASSCLGSSGSSDTPTTVDNTTYVTKSIGPDGDQIVVSGATVTIPKDALPTPLDITISTNEGEAVPDGFVALSGIYHCGPSGTSFNHAVVMKMPFTDDGKGPATMFWSSNGNPDFNDVGGTAAGGFMTANVMHFSSGFVGRKK